ncbi:OadG family protein [Telmatospirillum siberiense]|uniref:Oxaloacetate decarboxylase, gamma chain n=1 Tax=Telmatospirillum siberiense TaxID=382514 RepID=A0A2N3PM46_9PROT|nr:OadG family protein [Telmatospirillum siberiense]PKU21460.1 hypothetical protein CWS72_26550 [Telmatospirillum siberiense]
MTGATIEGVLAVIGAGTCLYWIFRILAAFLRRIQPPPEETASEGQAVPVMTNGVGPQVNDDIVVIAAAVGAMMSGHRIVHIQDTHSGASWSAEGRWMHQTSHNLH